MDNTEKIRRFKQIKKEITEGSYLNPFRAKEHIIFLLDLCAELADAIDAINQLTKQLKETTG